nr:MAG TPA: hypothetical protein [Caudoviricetes sp.]
MHYNSINPLVPRRPFAFRLCLNSYWLQTIRTRWR